MEEDFSSISDEEFWDVMDQTNQSNSQFRDQADQPNSHLMNQTHDQSNRDFEDQRLIIVFSLFVKYLGFKQKLKCKMVCKQWKWIVEEELKKCLFIASSSSTTKSSIFKYKQINEHPIIISALDTDDSVKLALILSNFPNLRSISVNKNPDDFNYFKTLMTSCPLLDSVFISYKPSFRVHTLNKKWIDEVGKLLETVKAFSIKVIYSLFENSNDYEKIIKLLLAQMKLIEEIEITANFSDYEFLKSLPNLHRLYFTLNYIKTEDINRLCQSDQEFLDKIELFDARPTPDPLDGYSLILTKFRKLKDMTFCNLNNVSNRPLNELIPNMINLEILKYDCCSFQGSVFKIALDNIKYVRFLNSKLSNRIFISPMRNLEVLFLNRVDIIPLSEDSLILPFDKLSVYCTNLKCLVLTDFLHNGLTSFKVQSYNVYKNIFEEISKLNNIGNIFIKFTSDIGFIYTDPGHDEFIRKFSNVILSTLQCPESLKSVKFYGLKLHNEELIDSWIEYVQQYSKTNFIFKVKCKSFYFDDKVIPKNFKIDPINY